MKFQSPQSVEFLSGRWSTRIFVVDANGERHEFVCGNTAVTAGDSVFFGTRQEFDEANEW